jgi:hypothetical protein
VVRTARFALVLLGLVFVGAALFVWRAAEPVMPPPPGLSSCGLPAGADRCEVPGIPPGTVVMIVALALIGVVLVVGAVVDMARRGR